MPNDCCNTLEVTGPEKAVKAFFQKVYKAEGDAGEPDIDFNTTVPMPKELIDGSAPCKDEKTKAHNIAEYGVEDWYHWALSHWSTKWSPYSVQEPKNIDGGMSISFDTAWRPADNWFLETSKQFPTLTFKNTYGEEGMDFYGIATYKNGECETEELDHLSWKLLSNEWFKEEYEAITKGSYKKVFDIIKSGSIEDCDLEKALVGRVKDKDLPLLVGFEFESEDNQTAFDSRLKGKSK